MLSLHLILKKKNIKFFKKKSAISFLNQFAKFKRAYSLAKIIAITGSAGKTSLKNLISDLLRNIGDTYSSPKSFNNHLGVPISVSNLSVNDKFGIFEIGMSKSGEIRNLSRLVKPDIGIITNVGEAHLENFKNVRGIAKAKSEIIENIKVGGTVILNKDDKFFNFLFKKAKLHKLKTLTFGIHKKSDISLKKINQKRKLSKVHIKIYNQLLEFEIRDLNIYNVLASVAVLKVLNIDIKKMITKFKNFDLSEGRGKKDLIKRKNLILLMKAITLTRFQLKMLSIN